MRITFQSYSSRKKVFFTCTCCHKKRKSRTFTAECTLNPFNTEARTPKEVSAQSKREVDRLVDAFMREPVCASCEAEMNWQDRMALNNRRDQQPNHEAEK